MVSTVRSATLPQPALMRERSRTYVLMQRAANCQVWRREWHLADLPHSKSYVPTEYCSIAPLAKSAYGAGPKH